MCSFNTYVRINKRIYAFSTHDFFYLAYIHNNKEAAKLARALMQLAELSARETKGNE